MKSMTTMPPMSRSQLAHDLLGRLEVVLGDGLLEVAAGAGELAGVDVDDGHRLGAVDDQRAAGQPPAVHRLGELLVDAVHGENVRWPVRPPVRISSASEQFGRHRGHIPVMVSQAASPDDQPGKSSLNRSRMTLTSTSGSS